MSDFATNSGNPRNGSLPPGHCAGFLLPLNRNEINERKVHMKHRTHCRNGHPIFPGSFNQYGRCKECSREAQRRYRERQARKWEELQAELRRLRGEES